MKSGSPSCFSRQTDVLPALSMCLEPPESGLLSRPPRNVRKERLANGRLLLQAYVFLGVLESLCAMSMWVRPLSRTMSLSCEYSHARRSFWYLQRNGVPFSSLFLKFGNYPAALTNDLLYEAQSVYFFTLVVMQWGYVVFFTWSERTRELRSGCLRLHIAIYSRRAPAGPVSSSSHRLGE
jgi:magnesium-transporting ATPase (P-type)